jgi:plastocyanin
MSPGRNILLAIAASSVAMNLVPALAATIQVTVDHLAYGPTDIKARVGDTITWVNKDILAHTATVKGVFDVMVMPGKTGTLTLNKAGEFDYICRFHPNMKGHISVAAQ